MGRIPAVGAGLVINYLRAAIDNGFRVFAVIIRFGKRGKVLTWLVCIVDSPKLWSAVVEVRSVSKSFATNSVLFELIALRGGVCGFL